MSVEGEEYVLATPGAYRRYQAEVDRGVRIRQNAREVADAIGVELEQVSDELLERLDDALLQVRGELAFRAAPEPQDHP